MLYIDPKDQDIVTADGTLSQAWEDRRKLRLEFFDIGKRIEALEHFHQHLRY